MRLVLRLTIIAGLMFMASMAMASWIERLLIYPFDPQQVTPAAAGLPQLRAHWFEIEEERLLIWTAPAKPGKPVILYFHGNAGNLALRAGRFRHFLSRGYGVIAPAYRGSSGSTGTPSQEALVADAAALYRAMQENTHPLAEALRQSPLVIYGESLGSAVAIYLVDQIAKRDLPQAQALILEAPFTNVKSMLAAHYPELVAYAHHLSNQWQPLDKAQTLTLPLFTIHGSKDRLIPIKMGRQIHAAAPSKSKQFLAVPGAGHTDLWRSDTLPKLWQFIDRYGVNR